MAYIPASDATIRMTTNADLRARAEKGDTLAQAELERRKTNRKARDASRKPTATATPAFAFLSAPIAPAAPAAAPIAGKSGRPTVKGLDARMTALECSVGRIEMLLTRLVQQ